MLARILSDRIDQYRFFDVARVVPRVVLRWDQATPFANGLPELVLRVEVFQARWRIRQVVRYHVEVVLLVGLVALLA
ncbi:hypothetical protein D3C84_920660 [compost metagenome]